jgi:hypothetical protein
MVGQIKKSIHTNKIEQETTMNNFDSALCHLTCKTEDALTKISLLYQQQQLHNTHTTDTKPSAAEIDSVFISRRPSRQTKTADGG